jgi:hypothetical protein
MNKKLKEIITQPQQSDMGHGNGYVKGIDNCTLKEILDFYAKNNNWGTICIYNKDKIVRKFDYDTYNNNIFYHHLSGWQYKLPVIKVLFQYCFMQKDINIYV